VRALRRNKLRSILTALGIIIGVASVVAMVAVGNGAQASITKQVSALGQNLLTVFAGSRRSGGVSSGLGSASTITLADAEAIRREVADVAAVSPEDSSAAPGHRQRTQLVHQRRRRIAGLFENPRLETDFRFDVHRPRRARRGQGRRDRFKNRE
jgi:ABC-type lipoprotein release transport system permease subunit